MPNDPHPSAAVRDGLADRIRSTRHSLGVSAETLARKVNVSTTSFLRWETGTSPQAHHIPALAEALGVSIEWLLTGAEGGVDAA
jgi:transcriptional regulator with XRE-family HTH domain